MFGILVCLGTALLWAIADVIRKKIAGAISAQKLAVWTLLIQLPLFGAWGFSAGIPSAVPSEYWLFGIGAGILNGVTVLGMLLAFSLSPISLTIPLLSLTPLFSAIMGYVFSGEVFSNVQWIGLSIASLGATALGMGKEGWFHEKGAWIMIGVAVLFSIMFTFDRQGLQLVELPHHAFFETIIACLFITSVVFFRNKEDVLLPQQNLGLLFAAVLAMTGALALQLYAFQIGISVSIVEATKRTIGIISSLLMGYLLFSESISQRKLASAAVLGIGIVVLLQG